MQQNGGSVMVISDYNIPADKYQQNANVDVFNGGF